MNIKTPPPPAIGSDRVLAYAFVDKSIKFTGSQRLFVDGEQLGRVPQIAICKSLNKDIVDYLILYCDKNWRTLGVAGEKTLARAVAEAERCYEGIASKFVRVNNRKSVVRKWIVEQYPKSACGFCGRMYFEVDSIIEGRTSVICSYCIENFSKILHSKRKVEG